MSAKTPMFPGWSALAGRASTSARARATARRHQLAQQGLAGMAALMDGLIAPELLAPAATGTGSRRRVFDTATTFHAFLWQLLAGQASCRAALQQVPLARAAAPKAARVTVPGSSTSAYCQARGRLDTALIHQAATAIARRMDTRARPEDRWLGREVKLRGWHRRAHGRQPRVPRRLRHPHRPKTRLRLSGYETLRPLQPNHRRLARG